ncbi:MAG: aldo/keto reductase [Christensenellales bacterium]|jgi:myo-inositol catabolism protein IolS
MRYNQLGKTDMKVSSITFGCWEMGGTMWEFTNDENNINAVRKALDLGINSFDTAEVYGNGHSEEVLGKALGNDRKNVIVATKVAPANLRPKDIRKSAIESLKRLKTDYIDLYYIHWPNAALSMEDAMGEMVRLKEEGLIRSIGASNHDVELLKTISKIGRVDAIQPEYSLLHRGIEPQILPWCLENDVAVLSYSSIAKGLLAGLFHTKGVELKGEDFRAGRRLFTPDHLEKERPLIELVEIISREKGIEMSQLAIAWLLSKRGMTSAIVGTQNVKHLVSNVKAVDISLSDDEMARLDELSAKVLSEIDGSLGEIAVIRPVS